MHTDRVKLRKKEKNAMLPREKLNLWLFLEYFFQSDIKKKCIIFESYATHHVIALRRSLFQKNCLISFKFSLYAIFLMKWAKKSKNYNLLHPLLCVKHFHIERVLSGEINNSNGEFSWDDKCLRSCNRFVSERHREGGCEKIFLKCAVKNFSRDN